MIILYDNYNEVMEISKITYIFFASTFLKLVYLCRNM